MRIAANVAVLRVRVILARSVVRLPSRSVIVALIASFTRLACLRCRLAALVNLTVTRERPSPITFVSAATTTGPLACFLRCRRRAVFLSTVTFTTSRPGALDRTVRCRPFLSDVASGADALPVTLRSGPGLGSGSPCRR